MKQTKQFLRPLLMAIVMMALSPAKAWAEKTFKILVSDDATSATLLYDEDSHKGSIILYSMSEFNNWSNNINNITLDPSMADYRPTDCSEWFYDFSGVTTINGLEYLNTSEVTSMYGMFRDCRKLTSLDLSNFDTSKVTNMSYMFGSCEILSTLTFPASFNTSKVTDMSYMFDNCQKLSSLDVSCFDTQEVMNMESMFSLCQNLISLSVSSFNTCNVENMSYMFDNCQKLSSLNLANFNTEKVTTMEAMFQYCSGLTSLDLGSFNTAEVTTMWNMFSGCKVLATLNLSSFNTAKVTNMSRMFYQCYELTSLDLSGFNTAKVTNMNQMFHQSAKLKNFTFGNFDMSNVTNISNMFYQCFAENKTLTFKSVPFLKDGSFNSALTDVASVTYQLDDNSTGHTGTNYLPNATSATYSHEMSNEYETLVLPFAVTYTADNGNYKLYRLSGTTGSDLYFTEYADGAEIAAGTPMAVKAVGSKNGAGKYEISFAGSGAVNTTITPVTKGSITFTGTYSDVKLNAGAGCNFDGEKFVRTTVDVTEKPFRCYITASGDELPAELRLVEHTHTEVTDEEVPATCTTPGHTAGKYCSVCGEVLEGLEVIPALGHQFGEDHICTVCHQPAAIAHAGTSGTCTWTIYENGDMIFAPTEGETGTLGEWWNWDSSPWYDYRDEIKSVKFQGEVIAKTCYGMFHECTNLTAIDFSGFNTENVMDFDEMFGACLNIQSLNLSGFNTEKAETMSSMFACCPALESLDLSSFNTANVQDIAYMFLSCTHLATLKLSNDFVLNEGVNKTDLFDDCGTLADELSIYYVIDESIKEALLQGTDLFELDAWGKVNFVPSAIVKDGVPFNVTFGWAWDIPAENVVFTRTFTAEKPASAMLPFTVAASQISGATFYEFKGVAYNTEKSEWIATMQAVSTVEAYKPYVVIRDGAGDITFGTGSQTVSFPVTPTASDMTTTDPETGWTFVALNEAKKWLAGDEEIGKAYGFAGKDKTYDDYSVAKGEFVKIAAGASAKPGRCYLVKNDGEPLTRATEELPATIKVRFISGSATGIGTLDTETGEMTLEGWYDLNGNKIEQPSKGGVYINNNKKVMVK